MSSTVSPRTSPTNMSRSCIADPVTTRSSATLQHSRLHSDDKDNEIVINSRPSQSPLPDSVQDDIQQQPHDSYGGV